MLKMNKIDKLIMQFLEKINCETFLDKFIDNGNAEFLLVMFETLLFVILCVLNGVVDWQIIHTIFFGYLVSYIIELVGFIKFMIDRIRSIIGFGKIQNNCNILISRISNCDNILYTRSLLHEISSTLNVYLSYNTKYRIGDVSQIQSIIGQIKLEISDLDIVDKKCSEKLLNNIKITYGNWKTNKTILVDLKNYIK